MRQGGTDFVRAWQFLYFEAVTDIDLQLNQLVFVYNAVARNVKESYSYVPGAPELTLARIRDTSQVAYWLLADQQGTVRDLIDIPMTTAMPARHIRYDAFGNLVNIVNGSGNPASLLSTLGYTGQEYDSVVGLSLHGARWYNPELGRFISQDPSGYDGGQDMNLYRYAFNNVSTMIDPSGFVGGYIPTTTGGSTSPLGLSSGNSGNFQVNSWNNDVWSATRSFDASMRQSFINDSFGSDYRMQSSYSSNAISPPPASSSNWSLVDYVDAGLDVAGTIDPFGVVDTVHAASYAARGRWSDAGLTLAGVIPYFGDAAKGAKYVKYADKAIDVVRADRLPPIGGVNLATSSWSKQVDDLVSTRIDAVADYGDQFTQNVNTFDNLAPSINPRSITPYRDPARPGYNNGATHIDHAQARSLGGTDAPSNLRPLPAETNLRKGGHEGALKSYEDYLIRNGMSPRDARSVIQSEIDSMRVSPPPRPMNPKVLDQLPSSPFGQGRPH